MKSGVHKTNFSGEAEYKSFYPTDLREIKFEFFDNYTTELLIKANTLIGELNGIWIIWIKVFLRKLTL